MAFEIIQNKYLFTPDTLYIGKPNNKTYIATSIKYYPGEEIVLLTEFADTWQEVRKVKECYIVVDIDFH